MFGTAAPDVLMRTLAREAATGRLGEVSPHFHCFGGLAGTARWAASAAAGRIRFERADRFPALPP